MASRAGGVVAEFVSAVVADLPTVVGIVRLERRRAPELCRSP